MSPWWAFWANHFTQKNFLHSECSHRSGLWHCSSRTCGRRHGDWFCSRFWIEMDLMSSSTKKMAMLPAGSRPKLKVGALRIVVVFLVGRIPLTTLPWWLDWRWNCQLIVIFRFSRVFALRFGPLWTTGDVARLSVRQSWNPQPLRFS